MITGCYGGSYSCFRFNTCRYYGRIIIGSCLRFLGSLTLPTKQAIANVSLTVPAYRRQGSLRPGYRFNIYSLRLFRCLNGLLHLPFRQPTGSLRVTVRILVSPPVASFSLASSLHSVPGWVLRASLALKIQGASGKRARADVKHRNRRQQLRDLTWTWLGYSLCQRHAIRRGPLPCIFDSRWQFKEYGFSSTG